MAGLNADLKGLRDGARASAVDIARVINGEPKVTRDIGYVRVYWPFVIFRTTEGVWNLTHALTGYNVTYHKRLFEAIRTAKKLRKVADFEFVSLRSSKWRAARVRSRGLIRTVRKVA